MSLDQCKISIKMCGPCSMCGVTCENEIDHFGHLFGGLSCISARVALYYRV